MAFLNLGCTVPVFTVITAPVTTTHVITCGQVISSLAPCITYQQLGCAVPDGCCYVISAGNNAATTTPDFQSACQGLQEAFKKAGLGDVEVTCKKVQTG